VRIYIGNGFLNYVTLGRGMPLLFIHGYPLSGKIWDPQVNALSDHASLISIDLRGHGESYPFEGPYSMDLLANDCKVLLDELNITEKVVVCGLSMGGYVAMAMYRNFPRIFKGMILTSTRPGPDTPEGRSNRDLAINNVRQYGSSSIADSMLPKLFSPVTLSTNPNLIKSIHSTMINTSVQGMIGALQGMRDRPDSTPLLAKISCPVLIIHGTDDQIIPMKEAELMSQQIPKSRLVKINNAGHLVNLEQPELYNQALLEFLNTLI
jgi:pimeloyl-ACP methyl ester carboxylesterase